jgi:hypothetical protein
VAAMAEVLADSAVVILAAADQAEVGKFRLLKINVCFNKIIC